MSIPWPSERMSRTGMAEFMVAAAALLLGVRTLQRAGLAYLAPPSAHWPLFAGGFAGLIVCGFCLFRIVRRREYPWILAFAAIALPLFEPSQAPYLAGDRVVFAIRDLTLVGAVVVFLIGAVRGADELERRVHLEALSWSYAAVVVALVSEALVEDVLPPIRGPWVASAMLATWFVAWVVASVRYQR